ncbi:uncharacterized protein LOC141545588 isoform X1 [Sminthopsis crassicaudata]|uniref:uncharacterized protein LOC141545588 isoform X1 n=1 Tax=Sminthopsis crassicaudata TaxID=9301 RepID=UPI003D689E6F
MIPMYTLHAAKAPTHWAITPNLPKLRMMTWVHESIPLKLTGNGSFLVGSHIHPGYPERQPQMFKQSKDSLTFMTTHLPLCIVLEGQGNDWCATMKRLNRSHLLHSNDELNNISTSMMVQMKEIHGKNTMNAVRQRCTDLLSCIDSKLGVVFGQLRECSTGLMRKSISLQDGTVNLTFWDRNADSHSQLIAPVFYSNHVLQPHLWKVGLVTNRIKMQLHISNNQDRELTFTQWHRVFGNKNSTCRGGVFPNSTLCYSFEGQLWTLGNALFLICLNSNYKITKAEGVLQGLLKNLHHRGKREGGSMFLSLAALALSITEEFQIRELNTQLTIVAEKLQKYMTENDLAWRHQEAIDSMLISQITQLQYVSLELVKQQALLSRYVKLTCSFLYCASCILPVLYNSSDYAYPERLLHNASMQTSLQNELMALDKIINGLENVTIDFNKKWEESTSSLMAWLNGLDYHNVIHWLILGCVALVLVLFMLCILPLIIRAILFALCRSLTELKASYVLNAKGDL